MLRDLPPSNAAHDGRGATQSILGTPKASGCGDRTTKGVRLPYLPGLDGLRAFAVIAVLLYHAQLHWVPGGFLGVDVFFVISGYLIASLLLAEWRQKGRIDLKSFWLRRARRLLPALYLLLVVTLAFAVVFLPDEVARLRSDAIAAFGYVTNWYLVFGHQSYFETVGRPSLLQHLWSLAVEEQFYLLWPLLFVAGMMTWQRIARRAAYRTAGMLLIVLVGTASSTLLMALLYRPNLDPSRLYYGTDTRATALLIGVTLAFVWAPGRSQFGRRGASPLLLDVVGLATLGGLLFFCLWLDESQAFLFRGGFALVALTSAVLIMILVHPHARLIAGLLGWQPLRWLGLRSYGIYLWHWPVFMVTRPQLDVPITGLPLLALQLAATVVLASLSYRFVETPIRTGALGRAWRALREARGVRRWRLGALWAGPIGTGAACGVMLGVAVVHAQPPAPPSYLSVEEVHTENSANIPQADTEASAIVPKSDAEALPLTPETDAETSSATPHTDSETSLRMPEAGTETSSTTPDADVERAETAPTVALTDAPVPPSRVSAIGDSVMLGVSMTGELERAANNLDTDAQVGRQVSAAIDILRQRRAADQLGEVVVVHLGTNGTFTSEQFDEMMGVLAGVRKVVFVNVKVPRSWEQPNNAVLADGVRRYPNTVLVDWHAASAGRPDLFWDDGIHLRPEGARVYADLIAAQVKAP